MHIDFLLDVFSKNRKEEAIIWKGEHFDYEWLLDRINYWKNEIQKFTLYFWSINLRYIFGPKI